MFLLLIFKNLNPLVDRMVVDEITRYSLLSNAKNANNYHGQAAAHLLYLRLKIRKLIWT